MNILEVRNLTVWFPRKSSLLRRTIGHVKAVTGVSFVIPTGKNTGHLRSNPDVANRSGAW